MDRNRVLTKVLYITLYFVPDSVPEMSIYDEKGIKFKKSRSVWNT